MALHPKGRLRIIDHLIAVMPDEPIRLRDWLTLLPEDVKHNSARGEARYLVTDGLTTLSASMLRAYQITEQGKQRRAEVRALLGEEELL
ncbi:hypothetical protein [Deinococcus hopiensis]|nr:hypothetical protein [Deinococcus hopiensis]